MLEMTTRRLLMWGDLDERRRRDALRFGTVLRWLVRAAVAAGIALLVWRQGRENALAGSSLCLAATVVVFAQVMLGAPFRMYWRVDSPLLARLPIPGAALFDVALVRSARATLGALVLVAPSALALAAVDSELAMRHLAIVGAVAVAAALFLPAVALGAGALVAGGKADSLVRAVGGADVAAPPTAWLGMLPGLAAAAVVLAVIGAAPWARGTAASTIVGPPAALLGGVAVASVLAALAARRAAAAVMPRAVREVAALDVQRLAHLEIHPPGRVESLVNRLLGARGALVHRKDARLMRRRYPMALVAGALTTLSLWIAAGSRAGSAWVLGIVVAFAAYGALVAWNLGTRPIETRTSAALPLTRADLVRAKTAWLATWMLLHVVLGAAAVAVRLPDGLLLAAVALAIALASIVLGSRLIARAL
jgi:hypothetical protein